MVGQNATVDSFLLMAFDSPVILPWLTVVTAHAVILQPSERNLFTDGCLYGIRRRLPRCGISAQGNRSKAPRIIEDVIAKYAVDGNLFRLGSTNPKKIKSSPCFFFWLIVGGFWPIDSPLNCGIYQLRHLSKPKDIYIKMY